MNVRIPSLRLPAGRLTLQQAATALEAIAPAGRLLRRKMAACLIDRRLLPPGMWEEAKSLALDARHMDEKR